MMWRSGSRGSKVDPASAVPSRLARQRAGNGHSGGDAGTSRVVVVSNNARGVVASNSPRRTPPSSSPASSSSSPALKYQVPDSAATASTSPLRDLHRTPSLRTAMRNRTLTPAQRARRDAAKLHVTPPQGDSKGAWNRSPLSGSHGGSASRKGHVSLLSDEGDVRTFSPTSAPTDTPHRRHGATPGAAPANALPSVLTPGLVGAASPTGSGASSSPWPLPHPMRARAEAAAAAAAGAATASPDNFQIPLDLSYLSGGKKAENERNGRDGSPSSTPSSGRKPRRSRTSRRTPPTAARRKRPEATTPASNGSDKPRLAADDGTVGEQGDSKGVEGGSTEVDGESKGREGGGEEESPSAKAATAAAQAMRGGASPARDAPAPAPAPAPAQAPAPAPTPTPAPAPAPAPRTPPRNVHEVSVGAGPGDHEDLLAEQVQAADTAPVDPEAGPAAAYGDKNAASPQGPAAAARGVAATRARILARTAPVTTVSKPASPARSPSDLVKPKRSLFPPRAAASSGAPPPSAIGFGVNQAPVPLSVAATPAPPPAAAAAMTGVDSARSRASSNVSSARSGASAGDDGIGALPSSRTAVSASSVNGGGTLSPPQMPQRLTSTGSMVSVTSARSSLSARSSASRRSGGGESPPPHAVVFDVRDLVGGSVSAAASAAAPSRRRAALPAAAANPHAVWEGDILWKIPFTKAGVPRKRFFQVVSRPAGAGRRLHLQWADSKRPRQRPRSIQLDTVEQILQGHQTDAFLQQKRTKKGPLAPKNEHLCFSLLAKTRSVDLAAQSEEQRDDWLAGLVAVVRHEIAGASSVSTDRSDARSDIATYRSSGTAKSDDRSSAGGDRKGHWLQHLFPACRDNDVEAVKGFIRDGCPVDLMEPQSGDTPLLIACRNGLVELAELALRRGAKNDPHPSFGRTGLQLAVAHGHHSVAKLLLETAAQSGCDKDIVNHADAHHAAALHNAAQNGDVRCAELLLAHYADLTLVNAKGRTPLHIACASSHNKAEGYRDCVLLLLDAGADAVIDRPDNDGNTALHLAAEAGSLPVTRALLESAANTHVQNVLHATASQLARARGHHDVVDALREYERSDSPPRRSPSSSRRPRLTSPSAMHGAGRPPAAAAGFGSPRQMAARYRAAKNKAEGKKPAAAAANAWSRPQLTINNMELTPRVSDEAFLPDVAPGAYANGGDSRYDGSAGQGYGGVGYGHDTSAGYGGGMYGEAAAPAAPAPTSYHVQGPAIEAYNSTQLPVTQAAWGDTAGAGAATDYRDAGVRSSHESMASYVEGGGYGAHEQYAEPPRVVDAAASGAGADSGKWAASAQYGQQPKPSGVRAAGQAEESMEVWEIHVTDEGHEYFYNTGTGASQWEDPRAAASEPGAASTGADATATGSGGAGDGTMGSDGYATTTWGGDTTGAASGFDSTASSGWGASTGGEYDGAGTAATNDTAEWEKLGYWNEDGMFVYYETAGGDNGYSQGGNGDYGGENLWHTQGSDGTFASDASYGGEQQYSAAPTAARYTGDASASADGYGGGQYYAGASTAGSGDGMWPGASATTAFSGQSSITSSYGTGQAGGWTGATEGSAATYASHPSAQVDTASPGVASNDGGKTNGGGGKSNGGGEVHSAAFTFDQPAPGSSSSSGGPSTPMPLSPGGTPTHRRRELPPMQHQQQQQGRSRERGATRAEVASRGADSEVSYAVSSVSGDEEGDGSASDAGLDRHTGEGGKRAELPKQVRPPYVAPLKLEKLQPSPAASGKGKRHRHAKHRTKNGDSREGKHDGVVPAAVVSPISLSEGKAAADSSGVSAAKPGGDGSDASTKPRSPGERKTPSPSKRSLATSPPPATPKQLLLPENRRYLRMIRKGVPSTTVRARMTRDGTHAAVISTFIREVSAFPDLCAQRSPMRSASPLQSPSRLTPISRSPSPTGFAPLGASMDSTGSRGSRGSRGSAGRRRGTPTKPAAKRAGEKSAADKGASGASGASKAAGSEDGSAPAGVSTTMTKEEVQADSRLAKYVKMRKVGIPLAAVKTRMTLDALDASLMEAFFRAYVGSQAELERLGFGTKKEEEEEEEEEDEKEEVWPTAEEVAADSKYTKYARMKKYGVPVTGIFGKMSQAGMSPHDIEAFMRVHATPAQLKTMGLGMSKKEKKAAKKKKGKPSVALRKLHWEPLSAEELSQSVWATPREGAAQGLGELEDHDMEHLKELFATGQHSARSARSASTAGSSPRSHGRRTPRGAPAVIETQRATNISISLTKLKVFATFDAVVSALLRLDAARMTPTLVDMMFEILPKDVEVKALQRFRGDPRTLCKAEKWLMVVVGVPRFRAKLEVFRLTTGFEDRVATVVRQCKIVDGAAKQIMTSERLKAVLAAVLAIGNFLNKGTAMEAAGFKLDSLAALTSTRAADKSTTVLDVLVSTVEKKGGAKLTAFAEDLSLLSDACGCDVTVAAKTARQLISARRKARAEAKEEAADIREEAERGKRAAAGAGDDSDASTPSAASGAGAGAGGDDPRKAMLASLLAARGGGGNKSKKKKKKTKHKQSSLPNVATLEDRKVFVRSAKAFVDETGSAVHDMERYVKKAQAASRALATFFAEPADTPSIQIFEKLQSFCSDFARSLSVLHRRKALQKRRSRQAASKGAKRGMPGGIASKTSPRRRTSPRPGRTPSPAGVGRRRIRSLQPPGGRGAPLSGTGSSVSSLSATAGSASSAGSKRGLPPLGLPLSGAGGDAAPSGSGASESGGGARGEAPSPSRSRAVRRAPGEGYALQEKLGVIVQQWGYSGRAAEYLVRSIVRPPLANVRTLMRDPAALRAAVEKASAQYQRHKKAHGKK